MPSRLPMMMMTAEDSSIANPREGVILASLVPIALMILWPYTSSPTSMPMAPSVSIQ